MGGPAGGFDQDGEVLVLKHDGDIGEVSGDGGRVHWLGPGQHLVCELE